RFGLLLTLLGPATLTASETVAGVVTAVSEASIELKVKDGSPRAVKLAPDTKYVRWVTHQPWQQSNVADKHQLQVRRCVSARLKDDDEQVAELIYISMDDVGSIYSPCRDAR